ncbi:MAG: rhamnosidase, partial [Gammaproteobacteria bacterium]|nr:rhamnosidase [Gammaproteobacteria bacterium]
YRIVVASNPELLPNKADLWDSGDVESDQSVWLKYNGSQLQSRQKAYWQVMYRNQDGISSAWSEIVNFELGLLNNQDWQAKWIGLPAEAKSDTSAEGHSIFRPQYLRKDFILNNKIDQARLFITAKGVFEAQINGKKVSNDVMTPGWTPYIKRIETLSYDVSDYINNGKNTIGVILGEGWYSGRIGFNRKHWISKPPPKILCQLEISYKNGEKEIIQSDAGWLGNRNGPLRFSGIYDGEVYDANLEMTGWSTPEFDAENWLEVETEEIDSDIQLVPKRHAAVTNKAELPTLKVTNPEPGRFVFDLG